MTASWERRDRMTELRKSDHPAVPDRTVVGRTEFAGLGTKTARSVTAAAILIAIASIAAMMMFTGPAWDDFYHANAFRSDGSLYEYVLRMYTTWSGRWMGMILAATILSRIDLVRDYPVVIALFAFVQGLGIYLLWWMLLGETGTRFTRLVFTLATLAVLWANMLGPDQNLYWFSGALVYLLPVSLSLFLFAGLISCGRFERKSWWLWLIVPGLAALALAITGLHELCALSLCVALAAGTLVAWRNKAARTAWLIVLGTAFLGMLIALAAPGNFERARFVASTQPLTSVDSTIPKRLAGASVRMFRAVTTVGPKWLLDPKLLAMAALFCCNPYLATLYPGWLKGREHGWKWLTLGAWALLLVWWFALPSWVGYFAERTLGGAYFIFLIGWIATVFIWTRRSDALPASTDASTGILQSAALFTFAASLILTGNVRLAMADLLHRRPQAYRLAIQERESLIQRAIANGERDVLVPPIPSKPELLYFVDITEDTEHWSNRAVADYHGLRSLRLNPHAKHASAATNPRSARHEVDESRP
jgi:hypothetical protein